MSRLSYYKRIFSAYLTQKKSHLTFWHEVPKVNANFQEDTLGEYYMPFTAKAGYSGQFDSAGIPLLDYHGRIGLQYNPIAIAQYGLGHFNLFCRNGKQEHRRKFISVADWLVAHLELNPSGLWVWNHYFDWEYRSPLKAPWYSALAQGQGISLLVRAHADTDNDMYLNAAQRAFEAFLKPMDQGGVVHKDSDGNTWFEEYIVSPPTHILNGFIWASWGVYDYYLATGEPCAEKVFEKAIRTLAANIRHYDVGFWSLYELSGTRLKMVASTFYHSLHIVQLIILQLLTGEPVFRTYAELWDGYYKSRIKHTAAMAYKTLFKLCYY